MARKSSVHYIAPSAISITPNANGQANDLAVYIAKGTKIKVYCPEIDSLGMNPNTNSYREWNLSGRNRSIKAFSGPYTIYARLKKSEVYETPDAYLVFAKKFQYGIDSPEELVGKWYDKYSYVTRKGLAAQYDERGFPRVVDDPNYWWVKLGEVSKVKNGQRTVDLDTGILGTDEYNEEWELDPDALPMRVNLDCTVSGREAGAMPCVYWGTTLRINAHLLEGWNNDLCDEVSLWTIRRDTGNAEKDALWNADNDGKGRTMTVTEGVDGGVYEMSHLVDADDFDGIATTQFVITAWKYEDDEQEEEPSDEQTEEPSDGQTEEPSDEQNEEPADEPAEEDEEEQRMLVKLAATALTVQAETVSIYSIDISSYIDIVTVDDAGNLIGGLYTTTQGGNAYRTYRIHAAITVRKSGDPLLYEDTKTDEDENPLPASRGHYTIHGLPHNCEYVFDDSTIYITHIDNIKDGEAGTDDDEWTPEQYEAMRKMESCSVDLIADCEGAATVIKNFPVTIKHDSQPYIGAVLTNMSSGISWNTKTAKYIGLPVEFDVEMWRNDEYLSVTECVLTAPDNILQVISDAFRGTTATPDDTKLQCTIAKVSQTRNGKTFNIARVTLIAAPQNLPAVVPIAVNVETTYSGVDYERNLTHTLNKTTDTNIYQVKPSVKTIHVGYNSGVRTPNVGSVTCRVTCDSTDDKHYDVETYNGINEQHRLLMTRRIDIKGTGDEGFTVIGSEIVHDSESDVVSVDVDTMRNIRFAVYTVNDLRILDKTRSELDSLLTDEYWRKNNLHEEDSQDVPLTYDGIEGGNAVRIDLDNQADIISLDADSKVRFNRTVTTRARIYDGGTSPTTGVENTTSDSLAIGDCTPTVSLNDGVLTITWAFTKGMTADAATKTIKLTYNSEEYSAVFTLGATNSDAIYQLNPNKTSLSFGRDASDALTPSLLTVKCGYTKSTGSGDVPYEWPNDTAIDVNKGRIEYETGKYYYILFRLLDANGLPIPTFSGTSPDGWDWTSGYGQNRKGDQTTHESNGEIIILNTHTYSAVEFGLSTKGASYYEGAIAYHPTDADMIDIESIPIVRDGKNGLSGDTPISCFRWYEEGRTPLLPTDTTSDEPEPAQNDEPGYPVNKWSKSAINRPAKGWNLWMCQSTRHAASNGGAPIRDNWTGPMCISGADGTPGEDGKEREWIYQLGETSTLPQAPHVNVTTHDRGSVALFLESASQTVPPSTEVGSSVIIQGDNKLYSWDGAQLIEGNECKNGDYYLLPDGHYMLLYSNRWKTGVKVNDVDQEDSHHYWYDMGTTTPAGTFNGTAFDDFVPDGWTDNALVINDTFKFLFGCWRDYDHADKVWGDFQGPTIFCSWGHSGIDGDGVQYIFKLFNHELTDDTEEGGVVTPGERTTNIPTNANQDEYGEWMPTPNPLDPDDVNNDWSDDAPSPTQDMPFCYCSAIKKINGEWNTKNDGHGKFEKLGLWAKWSEDGASQPFYTETQEAWSNQATTTDVFTPPSDCTDDAVWKPYTPANDNHRAYLWRRSKKMVLQGNNTYAPADGDEGGWHYARLNGTNGTSINPVGAVVAIIASNGTEPTGVLNDLYIKQGEARLFKHDGTEWSQTGPTASDGDCYVVQRQCFYDADGDGHATEDVNGYMFMWSDEADGVAGDSQGLWISLGPFKGEPGVTYYTHIAWTDTVTLLDGPYTGTIPEGQKTTPNVANNAAVGTHNIDEHTEVHFSISPLDGYDWMGILINTTSADDPTGESRGLYTWKYVKGAAGTSPWMADLDNEFDGVICDASGQPVNNQTVQATLRLWYGSTPKPFTLAVTDSTPGGSTYKNENTETTTNAIRTAWTVGANLTERTLTVTFTTAADMNEKKVFCLQLTPEEGGIPQYLYLTVSGVKPGANGEPATLYNLVPSMDEITTRRTGAASFDPSTASLTCGYRKVTGTGDPVTVEDKTDIIDSKYYIYYRRHKRATASAAASWEKNGSGNEIWYRYGEYKTHITNGITNFKLDTYDKVQFIIYRTGNTSTPPSTLTGALTAENIIDRETVPVISDGADGGSVKADLDNENEIFLYDSEGHRVSAPATSQATLYDAASIVTTGVTWSIDTGAGKTHGVNVKSASAINDEDTELYTDEGACWITTSGLLHVRGMLWDDGEGNIITDAEVFIVGTYNGLHYHIRMTLHKQIGGVKYALRNITPNAISYDPATQTPAQTTISATVTRTSAADNNGVEVASNPPTEYNVIFCHPYTIVGSGSTVYVPLSGGVIANNTSHATYQTTNTELLANGIREVRIVIGQTMTHSESGTTIIDEDTVLDSETIPLATAATGPAGPEGPAGPTIEARIIPSILLFDTDDGGVPITPDDNKTFTVQLLVDGEPATLTSIAFTKTNAGGISLKDADGNPITSPLRTITSNTLCAAVNGSSNALSGSFSFVLTGQRDGKEYSAGASLITGANKHGTTGPEGPEGPQGSDGWTISVNPSPIILNQAVKPSSGTTYNNTSDFGLPQRIVVTAKHGSNDCEVELSDITSSIAGLTVRRGDYDVMVGSNNDKDVIVIVSYAPGDGVPTKGVISCMATLTDGDDDDSVTVPVSVTVAINMLGSFRTTIENDVETSVANSLTYAVDENAPSGIVDFNYVGTYIRSSKQKTDTLAETIENFTTANPANMFGFAKGIKMSNSTWPVLPYIQGYGIEVCNVIAAMGVYAVRGCIENIGMNGQEGTYVFSMEIKASQVVTGEKFSIIPCGVYDGQYKRAIEGLNDNFMYEPSKAWKRVAFTVELTRTSLGDDFNERMINRNGYFDISSNITSGNTRLFIHKLQIERASVPSTFGICKEDDEYATIHYPESVKNTSDVALDDTDKWTASPSSASPGSGFGPSGETWNELTVYKNAQPLTNSNGTADGAYRMMELKAANIKVTANTPYTLSFWAKASTANAKMRCFLLCNNDNGNAYEDYSPLEYYQTACDRDSGFTKITVDTADTWKKYYVHFYAQKNKRGNYNGTNEGTAEVIGIRITTEDMTEEQRISNNIYFRVCGLRLEKGYITSYERKDYKTVIQQTSRSIDMSVLVNSVKKAGIELTTNQDGDVVTGRVDVTADNFTVSKDGVQVFGVDTNTGMTTMEDVDIKGSMLYHKILTKGLPEQGDTEQLFTMYDSNGNEVQMTGSTASNKVVKIVLNYDMFIVSGAHKDFYQIFLPPAKYFPGAKIKIINGTYDGGNGTQISSNPSILDVCVFYANTGIDEPGNIDEFKDDVSGYMYNSIMAGIPFDYIKRDEKKSTLVGPIQTNNAIKVWDNHNAYGIRFDNYKTIELVSTLNTYLDDKSYYAWMIVDAR